MAASRWWYLDLVAAFPELEIYDGGWQAEQETSLLELGERAVAEEANWLPTWCYSAERDRVWAAVSYMFQAVRHARQAHGRAGLRPGDTWYPDVAAWESGKMGASHAN